MKGVRDYKAEYRRRIARAESRGLTRSQARGHARAGEALLRPRRANPLADRQLERGLKALRLHGTLSAAATQVNISQERLRRFLRQHKLAKRVGRSWTFTDNRTRRMTIISAGRMRDVSLTDFDQASLNGRYLAAVKAFLSSNDIELLAPFKGLAVVDSKGRAHPLETNPNILHRLAASGNEVFHEIYRLIF